MSHQVDRQQSASLLRNPSKQIRRQIQRRAKRLGVETLEARIVLTSVTLSGTSLLISDSGAESNQVEIAEAAGTITIRDLGAAISAGTGVNAVNANEVTVPAANVSQIVIDLGDLDDHLDATGLADGSGPTRMVIDGGSGNDTLLGSGLQDDFLFSGGNDAYDAGGQQVGRTDRLIVTADANMVFTDAGFIVGNDASTTIGFEFLSILGGASGNTIDLSSVTAASGVITTRIQGGIGDDVLIGSQLKDTFFSSPGQDSYDGQNAANGLLDELNAMADQDITLTNGNLEVGGIQSSHVGVEVFSLSGGSSANTIDASSVDSSGDIQRVSYFGAAGDDTLIGSQLVDFFIESPGEDSYDGQAQTNGIRDTLNIFNADVNVVLADGFFQVGSEPNYFSGLEGIAISAGASDNLLDASNLTLASGLTSVSYSGGDGNDRLEIDSLLGLSLLFDGQAGLDTLDLRGFTTPPVVNVSGPGVIDGQDGSVAGSQIQFRNTDDILYPQLNQAPEILSLAVDATMTSPAEAGGVVGLEALFGDADVGDMHTAMVDWGDGTSSVASVNQVSDQVTATHSYAEGGVFTVTLTVVDSEGALATQATTAVVSGVGVQGSTLFIVGTSEDDHIHVNRFRRNQLLIHAAGSGCRQTVVDDADSIDSIVAYLLDGDDHFSLSKNVRQTSLVRGGSGDDRLIGGGGGTVLLGESGDDRLIAAGERSILIGGTGRDRLKGGRAQDVLVGGSTSLDSQDAALLDVLETWSGGASYPDRIDAVQAAWTVVDDLERDRLLGAHEDWIIVGSNDRSSQH